MREPGAGDEMTIHYMPDLGDSWKAQPVFSYTTYTGQPPGQPDPPHEVTVRHILDLSQVALHVRVVRFGWRARLASYLIRLGARVGGSSLRFEGDNNG